MLGAMLLVHSKLGGLGFWQVTLSYTPLWGMLAIPGINLLQRHCKMELSADAPMCEKFRGFCPGDAFEHWTRGLDIGSHILGNKRSVEDTWISVREDSMLCFTSDAHHGPW